MVENSDSDIVLYPCPIWISLCGISEKQDVGYTVDYQTSSDEYHFVYFETPVTLGSVFGLQQFDNPVFVLYTPNQRQWYRADAPLLHTWFRMSGPGVSQCISECNIPINQPIKTKQLEFLAPLLETAQRQIVRNRKHSADAVTEIGRSLFRRVARKLYADTTNPTNPLQKDQIVSMQRVRALVFKDFRRRWTVEEMAAFSNMSATRFAVVYKSVFDIAPIDDLIEFRLRHADVLLRHLPISIAEAAERSGFNSASNFHVLYQERVGKSPRARQKVASIAPSGNKSSKAVAADLNDARLVDLLHIEPICHWSFDQAGNVIVDDLKKHLPGSSSNGVTKVPGRDGGRALHFEGSGYVVFPEAIVDTSRSYTISAWLLHDVEGRMTAVSIGDTSHGAFYLQYISTSGDGGFKFATTVSERDHLAIYVTNKSISANGVWYQVAGVHDAERREIRLYVDGVLQGSKPYKTAWKTEGSTYVGATQVMDQIADYWRGSIDDVRLYDRVLTESELRILAELPLDERKKSRQ